MDATVFSAPTSGDQIATVVAIMVLVGYGLHFLVGIAECFFGLRILVPVVIAEGVLIGGVIGLVFGPVRSAALPLRMAGNFAIGAAVGVAIMALLIRLLPVLVSALWVGSLGYRLLLMLGVRPNFWLFVVAAVVAGVATARYWKHTWILVTSFGGASRIAESTRVFATAVWVGVPGFRTFQPDVRLRVLTVVGSLVLGSVGAWVQFKYTAGSTLTGLRRPLPDGAAD